MSISLIKSHSHKKSLLNLYPIAKEDIMLLSFQFHFYSFLLAGEYLYVTAAKV